MELSVNNISIDILTSIIFIIAIWRGIVALYYNDLSLRSKLYIAIFALSSLLYVYQSITQLMTGQVASFAIWNVINGIHAFTAISIITLLAKRRI